MYGAGCMNVKEACEYLGLGRNTLLRLCQEHTNGFPAVRVGNRWQIDRDLLSKWKSRWYAGDFEI